jgi:hypothetical protein
MNAVVKSDKPNDTQVALVEGDIRDLLRDDTARKGPRPVIVGNGNGNGNANAGNIQTNGGDTSAADINALMFRAGQGSIKELDGLIATLQHVRDQLSSENERLQRAISKYVQSSHSAMETAKVIADSVAAWKPAAAPIRPNQA